MIGQDFRADFSGRSIIVTGGARGQGAAEVEVLARSGARVYVADVLETEGRALAERLSGQGLRVTFVKLDVADRGSWEHLLRTTSLHEEELWGLVNNAGVSVPGRVGNVTEQEWLKVIQINAWGALLGTQLVTPSMADGGAIVNVGSVASNLAHTGVAYGASKSALSAITRSSVVALSKLRIRVNQVNPGYIKTDLNAKGDPRFFAAHLANTPQGRAGTTSEVAHVVRFLLSDEASYVNGVEIAVDGGFSSPGGTMPLFESVGALD